MTIHTFQQSYADYATKILLYMNAGSGSTVFTDATRSRVWTTSATGAYIDTSEYKFGGASGSFCGGYISTPHDTNAFNIQGSPFTIDCWVKRSANGLAGICGKAYSVGSTLNTFYLFFDASNKLSMTLYDANPGGGHYTVTSSGTVTADGNWHHIAATNDSSNIRLFIDGVVDGTMSSSGRYYHQDTTSFFVGKDLTVSPNYFYGWIDDFRFTYDVCRWTSNFTLPTSQTQYMYAIDSLISAGHPKSNVGTSHLGVGHSINERSSLVKWDLSSLSGSDICDSATLSLSLYQDLASASVVWSAYRLKRDWEELTSTWNSYKSGASWQTAGALGANDIDTTPLGTSGSIAANAAINSEIQIPLNATEVQKMYDGTYVNYGFIVRNNPITSVAEWNVYSRELAATYDAYKPKLTINIHTYDPTPYGTYDQYTKALLHFDGEEGSYTFRDEIQNTWTPYRYPSTSGSGPYISTSQKKFGTGSGYFAGSAIGDWIQTDTDFQFGSQDWTADFWIRPNFDAIGIGWATRNIFGYDGDDSNFWQFYIGGSTVGRQAFWYSEKLSGTYIICASGSYMPLQENVWQHVACVRQGTSIKGYLNGTLYFSGFCSATTPTFSNQVFRIGNVGTTGMFRGYMDEFRLSIGIARWTSNFIPPDRAYAPITAPKGQPVMYSAYPWM